VGKLLSRSPRQYIIPVLVAAAMSYISSRYLFVGSGLSLIPWGLLALGFGFFTKDKQLATQRGLIYGFAQSFIFLWIDKSGITSVGQFLLLAVIISALGIFGAGCGWILSRIGWLIRRRFTHKAS
jgi:hypothetical protein